MANPNFGMSDANYAWRYRSDDCRHISLARPKTGKQTYIRSKFPILFHCHIADYWRSFDRNHCLGVHMRSLKGFSNQSTNLLFCRRDVYNCWLRRLHPHRALENPPNHHFVYRYFCGIDVWSGAVFNDGCLDWAQPSEEPSKIRG
jgi:hypothetical protein